MAQTFNRAAAIAGSALVLAVPAASAATVEEHSAGRLSDGRDVRAFTLTAANGISAMILAYGATLQAYVLPDRHGRLVDVVLGHDTAAEYEATQDFFGATVGRYANRIAKGTFQLDGQRYRLPLNNGANSLHGGGQGFDRQLWTVTRAQGGHTAIVELAHTSPDGTMGFPGELRTTVTYALDDIGELTITMTATTTKPTIVNLTNHALFNLAGHCAPQGAMGQLLTIPASRYTPVDESLIPSGEPARVAGTVFDFRKGRILSEGLRTGGDEQIRIGRGYDHNWVLDKGQTTAPGLVARAEDPASGRAMEVLSTEPGLQMYSGNFLDGTNRGKGGCIYRMGDGFALEPQKFPDTPNRPDFGSARLDPGQEYRHVMIYRPAKPSRVP